MRVIFISGLLSPKLELLIQKNTKRNFQAAATALSMSILKGLEYFTHNIHLLSAPLIGSYPLTYKKVFFCGEKEFNLNGIQGFCAGSFNLPVLKLVTKYCFLKRYIRRIKNSKDDTWIFVYGLHTPYLKSAVYYKKKFPSSKICLIVPDLSQYMSFSRNPIYLLMKKIDISYQFNLLSKMDAFVFLSEEMNHVLNINKLPYVVVEGVYENIIDKNDIKILDINSRKNVIMYSGSLDRRYGIVDLLDAFSLLKQSDCSLWICGDGDMRDTIVEKVQKDERIVYFGQLPRSEILQMQKNVKVLVNPRSSFGEYTKYSFPSKTIEYLASGTPCVMRKLPTIPAEYYEYLYFTLDDSVCALAKKLEEVLGMSVDELNDRALKAAIFINENKNYISQTRKIIAMLQNI